MQLHPYTQDLETDREVPESTDGSGAELTEQLTALLSQVRKPLETLLQLCFWLIPGPAAFFWACSATDWGWFRIGALSVGVFVVSLPVLSVVGSIRRFLARRRVLAGCRRSFDTDDIPTCRRALNLLNERAGQRRWRALQRLAGPFLSRTPIERQLETVFRAKQGSALDICLLPFALFIPGTVFFFYSLPTTDKNWAGLAFTAALVGLLPGLILASIVGAVTGWAGKKRAWNRFNDLFPPDTDKRRTAWETIADLAVNPRPEHFLHEEQGKAGDLATGRCTAWVELRKTLADGISEAEKQVAFPFMSRTSGRAGAPTSSGADAETDAPPDTAADDPADD